MTISKETSIKEKILSYVENTSIVAGTGFGVIIGTDTAARHLAHSIEPVTGLIGAGQGIILGGILAMVGAKTIPILINTFNHVGETIELDQLMTPHNHKPSAIAGIFTGAALAGALMLHTIGLPSQGEKVKFSTAINGAEHIISQLVQSDTRKYDIASL